MERSLVAAWLPRCTGPPFWDERHLSAWLPEGNGFVSGWVGVQMYGVVRWLPLLWDQAIGVVKPVSGAALLFPDTVSPVAMLLKASSLASSG